jgi:predicted permease
MAFTFMAPNQFIMKTHFVINLMVYFIFININTFLSTTGQTYKILKHDTVLELHSFLNGGSTQLHTNIKVKILSVPQCVPR